MKTGKVQAEFPAIGKYYKNICYLGKTRKNATELCCYHFVQNKDHCEVNFKYNGKIEHYKVAVGMPMLVTQNLKKEEMYNMMEFEIEEMNITEHELKINYICTVARKGHCNLFFFFKLSRVNEQLSNSYRAINKKIIAR